VVVRPSPASFCICIEYEEMKEKVSDSQQKIHSSGGPSPLHQTEVVSLHASCPSAASPHIHLLSRGCHRGPARAASTDVERGRGGEGGARAPGPCSASAPWSSRSMSTIVELKIDADAMDLEIDNVPATKTRKSTPDLGRGVKTVVTGYRWQRCLLALLPRWRRGRGPQSAGGELRPRGRSSPCFARRWIEGERQGRGRGQGRRRGKELLEDPAERRRSRRSVVGARHRRSRSCSSPPSWPLHHLAPAVELLRATPTSNRGAAVVLR
jgi:hypothetical protein